MEHDIPEGDILIHAGDFTEFSSDEEIAKFQSFLESLKHKHIIIIGGNHDETVLAATTDPASQSEEVRSLLTSGCCTYLNNEVIEIESIKIYGIPWVKGGFQQCQGAYSNIPEDVDILITHAPPLGYGDSMIGSTHSGDQDLLTMVLEKKPRFHVYGHAHEGYGTYKNHNTVFINAATCSRDLSPIHAPVVFDVNTSNERKDH